jgi:predicted lipoprotein with Yx(FWY)xxD motif
MPVPRLRALLLATGLVLAGCGASTAADSQTTPASSTASTSAASTSAAPTSATSEPAATGQTVKTGGSDYGTMLFDLRGQAIYLFDKETTSTPACYGACAANWPPVLTDGQPVAAGEAHADLLGTTPRDDGTVQVTYAGHPLYYYAHEGPGQVLCHGVKEYGGTWLVVTPGGTPAAV